MTIDVRPDEVWKLIEGQPGYMVSNHGRFMNVRRERILKQSTETRYIQINLGAANRNQLAHRLVGLAFIPNPDNLPEVNHKDKNKRNNVSDNLEWCTTSENQVHSKATEYEFLSPDGRVHHVFGVAPFARRLGLQSTHLFQLVRGQAKSHKGWRFINE